jgi:SSS family solute:Na+ symporter
MKKLLYLLPLLCVGCTTTENIKPAKLADYPIEHGVAGAFAGIADNRLVVAGGCYFPEGKPWDGGSKFWDDRIYVLDHPDGEWTAVGRLPAALSYGMTLGDGKQLLCFGGEAKGKISKKVYSLQPADNKTEIHPLPPLPHEISKAGKIRFGNRLYLFCGKTASGASRQVWSAPLPYTGDWRREANFPEAGRTSCSVAIAGDKILLFGGRSGNALHEFKVHTDVFEYSPASNTWRQLLSKEEGIAAQYTPIASTPNGPVLFGSGGSKELSLHQRIKNAQKAKQLEAKGDEAGAQELIAANKLLMKHDKGHSGRISRLNLETLEWETLGSLPNDNGAVCCSAVAWNNGWVVVSGELRPGVRSPRVLYIKPNGSN